MKTVSGSSQAGQSEALSSARHGCADQIGEIYDRDGRRVFATLVRLLGDFDLAEEALLSAFLAASERWPAEGMPRNPAGCR